LAGGVAKQDARTSRRISGTGGVRKERMPAVGGVMVPVGVIKQGERSTRGVAGTSRVA